MKVRNGFVSNSSSSSFILKTSLTKDELKENVKKFIHAWVEYQKTMSPNNYKWYSEKYTDAIIDDSTRKSQCQGRFFTFSIKISVKAPVCGFLPVFGAVKFFLWGLLYKWM